ncbi:MAG: C-GCAxxG-C-C family protein, partial [Candidatus Kapabacteria bacterium]|nr:C-GCAxxG-C-C family protein [Candidatus Kapabacteria bacterium]
KKELAYKLIQEFNEEFTRRNGSIDCSSLLNCKLNTDEGQKYIEEHNLFEVVCEKCIRESVKIVAVVGK